MDATVKPWHDDSGWKIAERDRSMQAEMSAATPSIRLPWIDAARGIAIVAMVVYHFSWDLRFFGFIATDVASAPGWVIFARLIAGSFLFLVGVGLVLAARGGIDRRRFLIRLAMIAAGASAVSLGTWFAIPNAFVFFGILHLIAVSSVLGLLFLRLPALAPVLRWPPASSWPGSTVSLPIFDQPWLLWIGLGTVPPVSNDYTPIVPWFGVVLAGMATAKLLLAEPARRHRARSPCAVAAYSRRAAQPRHLPRPPAAALRADLSRRAWRSRRTSRRSARGTWRTAARNASP